MSARSDDPTLKLAQQALNEAGGEDLPWRRALFRKKGEIVESWQNVAMLLSLHPEWQGVLAWDEFATRPVALRDPPIEGSKAGAWDEALDLEFGLWLAQQCQIHVRDVGQIRTGLKRHFKKHRVHPVRDYFATLAHDGVPRLANFWSTYFGAKQNTYAELSARFFWLGLVARVYEPGCIMRLVPVLEGTQYRGKSAGLRAIGGRWFSDTTFTVGDKDAYLALQGCLLYEIAEFDAFSRAEATRVKAFISSQEDRFRPPYGDRVEEFPRQCVFAATTNQHEYFKDPSGNTRFAPIAHGEVIRHEELERDRDQLFAEAIALYRAGARRYATREEQDEYFTPEQEAREVEDPWFARIFDFLAARTPGEHVTVNQILEDCIKVETAKIDNARQMATRVGIAVRRAGWAKRREPSDLRGYYYVKPEFTDPDDDGKVPF